MADDGGGVEMGAVGGGVTVGNHGNCQTARGGGAQRGVDAIIGRVAADDKPVNAEAG